MAGGPEDGNRSVTSRVAAILMAFGSGGTHSLSELAGLAGLPVSTTHRLVGELVSRRVLERTERGGYRVGLPLRLIGAGSLQNAPPLLDRGLEVIADLAEVTRTTVRIGVLTGVQLSVAGAAPHVAPATGFAPDPEPAHRSALGRALLAFSPAAVVEEALASARDGGRCPGAPEQMRRILALTRQSRVAMRRDECGALCSLAVPVFGAGGTVLSALEADVAGVQDGASAVRSALLVAAGSLSRELATAARPDSAPDAGPDAGASDSEASRGRHCPAASAPTSSGPSPVAYHS